MRKKSFPTMSDNFAGCGGSSRGGEDAGATVIVALNHWPLAVDTHNTNFPNALHECTDISACDPRRYPSTDIHVASPECTNQTGANGKKKPSKQFDMFQAPIIDAAAERSRATMWDVPRFAEYHRYNVVIVENVVEAKKWVMFDAWLMAMHLLGYKHKCCYLNSMHFWPCPQSRDRMYVVFWKKGNKAPDLDYKPLAYCPCCNKDVNAIQSFKRNQKTFKYKTGYTYHCPSDGVMVEPYYYAAFNCIDWSIPGRKIGSISPALVENTIRRIQVGRERYWNNEYSFDNLPFIIKGEYTKAADDSYVRHITDALPTQSTRQTFGIVAQPPLIVHLNRTGTATPVDHPLSSITAGGRKHGLLLPFVVENKGDSTARGIHNSLSTITTTLSHGILSPENFNSFISYYNGGSDVASHITDAAGAFTGSDRLALVKNAPALEECYYRTLKAHEVKLGMAFPKDYIILGDSKDQVRQCGNAVTPPVMKWLVGQTLKTL